MLDELYRQEDGGTGGPAHAVTDDDNVDDDCVRWSLNYAAEDNCVWQPRTRELSRLILEGLIAIPEDQRIAVLAKWGKCF